MRIPLAHPALTAYNAHSCATSEWAASEEIALRKQSLNLRIRDIPHFPNELHLDSIRV